MTGRERRMNTNPAVDPARCPLCGGPNRCAMVAGQTEEPCWCTKVTLTTEMLERIAPSQRGVACICAECAAALARELG
jgi:hypothetical protein